MPWLVKRDLPDAAQKQLTRFVGELAEKLDDPSLARNETVRETLAQVMHGSSFDDLNERAPLAALSLDSNNITFEAEYYTTTLPEKFLPVKPLLWLWKCLDQTPLGQSAASGLKLRAMLAERIFKRVGKNFKAWQNVEFSVGYNLEVGDDVTLHRYVFVDDIGGVVLHDGVSLSDYVNVYSHTHDTLTVPDVTFKQTVIGRGVRVAYHATVLAGTILSDDSMLGAMALGTRDLDPHVIGLGIPAKPRVWKERAGDPNFETLRVNAATYKRQADVRANPEFADTQVAESTDD